MPPASTLSENLNAVNNQTRSLIHQVLLRSILQQGLDDFQKCFIDSTAVEANTERPTDSTILPKNLVYSSPLNHELKAERLVAH